MTNTAEVQKPLSELIAEMKAAAEKANTDAEHNDWGYDTDAFHDVSTPDNTLTLMTEFWLQLIRSDTTED